MKHSPLPWHSTPNLIWIVNAEEKSISHVLCAEDAEFICLAVNCHEELVEALKAISCWSSVRVGGDEASIEQIENIARAVLKKAGVE